MTYDLGSGRGFIQTRNEIQLNSWHTIIVQRTLRSGSLQLDDHEVVIGVSPGSSEKQEVGRDTYIGGVPDTVALPLAVAISSGKHYQVTHVSYINTCASVVNILQLGP